MTKLHNFFEKKKKNSIFASLK
jgi:hypothetical protein